VLTTNTLLTRSWRSCSPLCFAVSNFTHETTHQILVKILSKIYKCTLINTLAAELLWGNSTGRRYTTFSIFNAVHCWFCASYSSRMHAGISIDAACERRPWTSIDVHGRLSRVRHPFWETSLEVPRGQCVYTSEVISCRIKSNFWEFLKDSSIVRDRTLFHTVAYYLFKKQMGSLRKFYDRSVFGQWSLHYIWEVIRTPRIPTGLALAEV